MTAFKPYLDNALKNTEEYQVCLAAVGVVGDLCRALGKEILPFCDEIMLLLLADLSVSILLTAPPLQTNLRYIFTSNLFLYDLTSTVP
jgi:hypothetical protein